MKKILTIILDGFGIREESHGNAIKEANMEFFNKLWEEYPHSLLEASGTAVGLSEDQFGNSETGHMTIGAGRKILQNETVVDNFLSSDLETNEEFLNLLSKKDKDIHLMGLLSDGGIHSQFRQILKFYHLLIKNGFKSIYFHVITDGRDTDINSAYKYIKELMDETKKYQVGSIATICGRYYAMDRDKRFERTEEYYNLVVNGRGYNSDNIKYIIDEMYKANITDEFLKPILVNKKGLIKNGDVLVWLNFRSDRAKQIIDSFTNRDFFGFSIKDTTDLSVYSFMPIDENIKTRVFCNEDHVSSPLGVYLSKLGLTQARIAETEKFAHVTYFFDGGSQAKLPKCNHFLIPSPKVSTYDLQPEMSAIPITKKAVECMIQDYDFILVNYANTDMVGHTGNMEATIQSCIAVDLCLNKIVEKAEENFYKVIILADHGNADIMIDENGKKVTTHTTSKVPFIILDKNVKLKETGDLTMVAPTILEYMDIAVPDEMTETDILIK